MTTVKSNYDSFTDNPFIKDPFRNPDKTTQIQTHTKSYVKTGIRRGRQVVAPGDIISMYGLSCFDT